MGRNHLYDRSGNIHRTWLKSTGRTWRRAGLFSVALIAGLGATTQLSSTAQQLLTSSPLPEIPRLPNVEDLPVFYPMTEEEYLKNQEREDDPASLSQISTAAGPEALPEPPPPPPPPPMEAFQQLPGVDPYADEAAPYQAAPSETGDSPDDFPVPPSLPGAPEEAGPPLPDPAASAVEAYGPPPPGSDQAGGDPAIPALPTSGESGQPPLLPTLPSDPQQRAVTANPIDLIQPDLSQEEKKREENIERLFDDLLGREAAEEAKRREQEFEIDFGILSEQEKEKKRLQEEKEKRMTPAERQKLMRERAAAAAADPVAKEEPSVAPDPRLQPERSRRHNYKTLVPSTVIARKQYGKENEHLPQVIYQEDFYHYLYAAAYRGNLDGIRALLDKGIPVDARIKDSDTALMAASFTGQLPAVRVLLLRGADPNLRNRDGNTALHMAAYSGRVDVIRALIHMGASPNALNASGLKPEDVAAQNGRQEAAAVLRDAGIHSPSFSQPPSYLEPLPPAAPLNRQGWEQQMPPPPVALAEITTRAIEQRVQESRPIDWFNREVPVMPPYYSMTPQEQSLWRSRLEDWMEADRQFDRLSFEDKVEYNYRRKVLEQVFPEHFKADNPVDQLLLDNYMKRWTDFDQQLRMSMLSDPSRREVRAGEFYGSGLNFTPTPLDLSPTTLFGIPAPDYKPRTSLSPAPPQSMIYSDIKGPDAGVGLTERERLYEILENWKIIDNRFDDMTLDQKLRANRQRRRLLDMLVFDSGVGTYARAFANLGQSSIDDFINAMAKWDQFEEWLKNNMPELSLEFPAWGGNVPTSALIRPYPPLSPDEVRSDKEGAPHSIHPAYPTHDRTKYRLLRSVKQMKGQGT